MKLKMTIVILTLAILCSGCGALNNVPGQEEAATENQVSPSNAADQESMPVVSAEEVLTEFYQLLNDGKYDQAAILYGGSYEMLQGYNPDLDNEDYAGLLKAGCELNGLMCLKVLEVLSSQTSDEDEFIFEIALANPDGSQFVLGPCCGATEEEMPPQSSFVVRVVCQEDVPCLVIDLPPYVP